MELLLLIIFLPIAAVRFLRWAAIVQQKEYRFDRLRDFFSTSTGKNEFALLIPSINQFTKAGLKRPRLTLRSILTMVIALSMIALVVFCQLLVCSMILLPWVINFLMLFLLFTGVYILIPVFFMVAMIPTMIGRALILFTYLTQASNKLAAHTSQVIGITGSYGKTSTKLLLAHVLSQKYSVFVTPKSHNNLLSVAQAIIKNYSKQKLAVIEYGAYGKGDIAQLAQWVKPDMAIITGFTLQHIGLFGSAEAIQLAKAELIIALPNKSDVFFAGKNKGVKKIVEIGVADKECSKHNYDDLIGTTITHIHINKTGTLQFDWKHHNIKTQLIGEHYIGACAAVISVAGRLELDDMQIITGLESFEPSENFIRSYVIKNILIIDDGLSCNPEGFTKMCELATNISHDAKKHLIFGGIVDLGKYTTEIHTDLAQKAKQVFSDVWYTGAVGNNEFATIWGDRFHQTDSLKDLGSILQDPGLIVLEGKMPPWLTTYLKKQRHKTVR